MHDPYTLVADLRFIQIWHRDKHGHDGACGWSFPNLTNKQQDALKNLGWWEGKERHFLRYAEKEHKGDIADREALYRAAVLGVARALRIRMTYAEAAKIAALKFAVGGCDGADGMFCFLPGYHSNSAEDRDDRRAEHWTGVCFGMARQILRSRRSWWQHPKWHIHHWRFHVPVLSKYFGWSGVH